MIKNDIQHYIKEKLEALSKTHHIRILLAAESGSRAWGFPSKDSDYDVRFIYVRSQKDYLSLASYRDVIESALIHDDVLGVPFDLNGWDIRKALQLAIKSNPVLWEWIVSPIHYFQEQESVDCLKSFVQTSAYLPAFAYHYDRIARYAWMEIEKEEKIKLKKYCYALRPALALAWIRAFSEIPPMDMANLCNKLSLKKDLIEEIQNLIDAKACVDEKDLIQRNPILDEYIQEVLSKKETRVLPREVDDSRLQEEGSQLFRSFL